MKNIRRGIALFLSMLLLLSCFATASFAADENLQYLILGDSIGYGAGVLNPDEACFGRIVANTNGYAYQNYAVCGHRTENLLKMLQREQVAQAVKDADIISISIGGNDFLTDNAAGLVLDAVLRKDYTRMDSIAAQLRINFAEIIETILALNPDVTILMQTLYNPGKSFYRAPYQEAADRINNTIRDYLADHPGAYTIVDVATAFGDDPSYIAQDVTHPSAKGNEKIATLILETLHDLGLGSATEPTVTVRGVDQNDWSLSTICLHIRHLVQLFRNVRFGMDR